MSERSDYTKAETQMILCMTRERFCTPDKCKKCGWLSDKERQDLQEHGDEPQWIKEERNDSRRNSNECK